MSPYAKQDRLEFLERIGISPDARILEIGADGNFLHFLEGKTEHDCVSLAATASIAKGSKFIFSNEKTAVIVSVLDGAPFRDNTFDAVFSYQFLNLVSPEELPGVFSETARVLKKEGRFAFIVRSGTPLEESQKYDLLLAEILGSLDSFWMHEHEFLIKVLRESGFGDITMDVVKRKIQVPERWIKLRIASLREKGDSKKIKDYASRTEYNEGILPALQFVAKKR